MGTRAGLLIGIFAMGCPTTTTTPTKVDSGATTSPTVQTADTSTPGTTDLGCKLQLNSGLDTCDTCIEENCCDELVAYDAAPKSDTTIQDFSDCSLQSCSDTCAWGICDSGLGLADFAVAVCMGNTCCGVAESCANNTDCLYCLFYGDPDACNATQLDTQFVNCAYACGYGDKY